MNFDELCRMPPYTLHGQERLQVLLNNLVELTQWHRQRCQDYNTLVQTFNPSFDAKRATLADLPWLPVSLFKRQRLSSVPENEVFRTLVSSGTTGQKLSQIVLDRTTADRQSFALAHIMKSVLGPERLPIILVDTASAVSKKAQINARTTGLLGMMNFGRDPFFLLDDDLDVNFAGLEDYLAKHRGKRLFVFGFTFMIWKYLYKALSHKQFDLSTATVVHGGGWKKLLEEQVADSDFRAALAERFNISDTRNFYGMVEQVGSIFMQSADGYLYAPNFADVLVRNPQTWQPAAVGEEGIIQVFSVLPLSYPGHSLLTEDLGTTYGEGHSPEGWYGTRLKISGRVPKAELRGCSDVLATMNTSTRSRINVT